MWTRLIAGATAHEINNLTHGLLNLLTLATQPGVGRDTLERMAAQAEERLAALKNLSRDLTVLARSGDADSARPHRLDHIISEALTETEPTHGRSIVLDGAPAAVWARGAADALRMSVRALLSYALAATPHGGVVHLGSAVHARMAVVTIEAAPPSFNRSPALAGGGGELLPMEGTHELHGDFGVMLAGALITQLGGELRAGWTSGGGLRFALSLPRVQEP